MSSLTAKLAKTTRRYTDVSLILDGEAAHERDQLLADLKLLREQKEAGVLDERLGGDPVQELVRAIERVTEEMRDARITLRVFASPVSEWMTETFKHEPRPGNPIDQVRGFNVEEATRALVQANAKLIDGEDLVDITPDEWAQLWDTITAGQFGALSDALFILNEQEGRVAPNLGKG